MNRSWYLFALLGSSTICTSTAIPSRPQRRATIIEVPSAVPKGAGVPMEAFVSFSIEFAFFPDYSGNLSHPNVFSNNLLNNLGGISGTKPYIRVGGNTQDYAYVLSKDCLCTLADSSSSFEIAFSIAHLKWQRLASIILHGQPTILPRCILVPAFSKATKHGQIRSSYTATTLPRTALMLARL